MANKLTRPPKSHSTKDVYKYYKKKHPKAKEPYWLFKEVIARFNKKAADAVIMGQVFNFGSRLGHLLIKKIRRNYQKPVVDWGESKRIRAELIAMGKVPKGPNTPEGEDWLIYYSDPWYLRWGWVKKRICRVKNQTVYKFMPTSSRSKRDPNNSMAHLGNKGKLTLANKLNPMLHLIYEEKQYSTRE
jgi:hypothetical protein